jgi:hypothetical protein
MLRHNHYGTDNLQRDPRIPNIKITMYGISLDAKI